MEKSLITHDRLMQNCYTWLHNSYPHLRKTSWAVINELKPYPGESIKSFKIRLGYLKAIGLVTGVYDYHFYYKGVLHCFDFKIDYDKLSADQLKFKEAIEANGGHCYEIRSLKQFQNIIKSITNEQSLQNTIL